jgi:hypothetical protein
VAAESVPATIEQAAEPPAERLKKHDFEPAPAEPKLAEVEYSWQDWPRNGQNGWHAAESPARTLRPWPAEPMIHRPDWW